MKSPELAGVRALARRGGRDLILNQCLASPTVPTTLRVRGLRAIGMRIGDHVIIAPRCWFSGRKVSIGEGTFINYSCFFDEQAPITIGAGCDLAMQVMICTSTHLPGGPARRAGAAISKPVTVGSGCWLGTRVTVLPGVTIADGCTVAAGAVVTTDCASDGLYAGIPATRVRDL